MTLLERVARAIYGQWPNYEIRFCPIEPGSFAHEQYQHVFAWEEAKDRHAACLETARIAVEAMREPSPDMKVAALSAMVTEIEAALKWGDEHRHEIDLSHLDGIEVEMSEEQSRRHYIRTGALLRNSRETDAAWRASIDAALSEPLTPAHPDKP